MQLVYCWFNFLSNIYPVVYEWLACCTFLHIYALGFSRIPIQVAKATGRAKGVGEVIGFCPDCNIHTNRIAFETHCVVAVKKENLTKRTCQFSTLLL